MGRIMKRKILALSLFSLCCLALCTGESQAFFGLLSPYHPSSLWHRHNRYVTHITCRPYNAFTPICWGNLVCDGCNPSPCGVASGCLPLTMGVPPWAYAAGCGMPCMGGACGPDFSHASDMPMMGSPPTQPMPDIRSAPYMPPAPMPLPSGPNTTLMHPQSGVSQANYHPTPGLQYPSYYMPTYYNPYQAWSQPMPYYWYGGGR
jgi:hypothetical protein